MGPQALSISPSASTCWKPRTEVSLGLKACAWLPSVNQHERSWSWELERGMGCFWLAWEHAAFSAWMLCALHHVSCPLM